MVQKSVYADAFFALDLENSALISLTVGDDVLNEDGAIETTTNAATGQRTQ